MTGRNQQPKREPLKSFRNLMTFRLHRLSNASQRFSEEYYRKLAGLSLVECRVIGILAELGTSTFGQVCETAGLDKSFGSRVVQRLTESGAIAKDGNPHDQRSVMLRLTDEGARLQNELHAAGRVLNQAMLADLSEDEALAFTTNLRRVAERLEKIEAAGVDAIPSAPAGVEACAPGVQLRLDTETAQTLYRMLGQTLRGNG